MTELLLLICDGTPKKKESLFSTNEISQRTIIITRSNFTVIPILFVNAFPAAIRSQVRNGQERGAIYNSVGEYSFLLPVLVCFGSILLLILPTLGKE